MRRIGTWAVFLVFGMVCLGCGDDKGLTTVNGVVTLNGEPIAKGNVAFYTQDEQPAVASAPIKEGRFTVRVPPGVMKVKMSASKAVGEKKLYDTPNSPTKPILEEQVPARYNSETELTLDVKPGRNPLAEFKLTKP